MGWKKLRRGEVPGFFEALPPCLVGIEACATAHYWARQISALGRDVRLMPPSYVKAYVRRQKNDAADAEASFVRARLGGTWSVDSIRASGHQRRANRPER